MRNDRVVLCMKWGNLYSAGYVNRLYRAVKDTIKGDFRFVCMTDDTRGLAPEIEARAIPDINLPDDGWKKGAWPKISVFKEGEFLPGEGRILFLDLDTFIVSSLESFFEPDDPFVAIEIAAWSKGTKKRYSSLIAWKIRKGIRWLRGKPNTPAHDRRTAKEGKIIPPNTMGTGIFSFEAGTLAHICDALMEDPDAAVKEYDNEQHFVECHLDTWVGWPETWVHSYKVHLRRPFWLSWMLPPKSPAPDVPIVAFHGDPRPVDLATGKHQSLKELPHCWRGPVKWAKAYWDKYGD